ncbi:2-hydroxychromene-2-carboxylate isomerase [Pyruvatibacter mobilis]|uniref:2-hydroxychromene-2-carboxylate isomerase n=1 Tax=Pyruvatibacter mobilis TaxID=1712261 RepID=UPI003BAE475D
MPRLTFWYDFASTYSYIAAHTVGPAAEKAGVDVVWRPFLLGAVFAPQGLTDSPFNMFELKGRYMWRDMQRLADDNGLPFKRPEEFPQRSILANRVAAVAGDHVGDVTRAIYSAEFGEGRPIATDEDLAPVLAGLGLDASALLADAVSPEGKQTLRSNTDAALEAGVFGAPTFTTEDGEVFWGSDRLAQALAWATSHTA